jgi:CBS domain-containing protein
MSTRPSYALTLPPGAGADTPVAQLATFSLVTVPRTAPLHEVARVLEQAHVSGVGVTDDAGDVVGVVSTRDLLAAVELETRPDGQHPIRPTARLAEEAMSRPVVAIDESRSARDAARLMVDHRIQRLFVVRAGKAAGVLSARDLLRIARDGRVQTPVGEVMTESVDTLDIGVPVRDAIARLAESNVHGLVVVDRRAPVGVFTHTEAIRARKLPHELLGNPVERVMSYEFVAVDVSTPLYRVAGQAIALGLRRVLVTENGVLCGIATGFDLVRHLAR